MASTEFRDQVLETNPLGLAVRTATAIAEIPGVRSPSPG